MTPSPGAQDTPPATANPPAGSGLFGSSSFANNFSNLAIGSNTQSAPGVSSSSSSAPFGTSQATSSPAPKGLFSHLAPTSFGSTPTQSTGLFTGFGAASPSSGSTNRPLFGETSGAQTNTTSSVGKGKSGPAANPFAVSVPPSSSTSGSSNTGGLFGGGSERRS